ncbi:hypothetical protein ASC97_05585 [Rhizobium sp. Root1203]|uniref:phage adaptor protein n=1 Tax=Rhizobium sp. Root1203 TaxID=1736427 RepID=UPI00070F22A8|nr:DUF6682 family protein [Rhizobium sp. Root1203]KQV27838.1 hypothetical protein ASC97_05585 [Rhizobium sp. Root1203]
MDASSIMLSASTLLLDDEHVRWPLSELAGWLDEGVRAIVTVKPSASSVTMELSLVRGTKQKLPEDDTSILQLLDVLRNIEGVNGAGGRAIRSASRAELDSNQPRWHDPSYVQFRKEVRQFVFDEGLPREFFVYPGNDGTGKIDAAVAKLPTTIVSRHSGSVDDISTWAIGVGIADQYQPALLDYVMYRAFSKEDPAAAPQRAVTHYQAFATAIGLRSQVESATSPGRK